MIRLEVMNRVCPKCGNGNWMRRIVGDKSDNIGYLNVKCLNCLSYFNEDDLSGVVKQYTDIKTNADRIRAMSDEELEEWLTAFVYLNMTPYVTTRKAAKKSRLLKWLQQEIVDKDNRE